MPKDQVDKSNLPSRHVTEGPSRAPHRSYFYAMGLDEEAIKQPWVGVATCWNEAAPCNISLNRQAQAVKLGVKKGYGTPREFTTITVTDGIAMGHEGMRSSLASREAIADTVELTMRGHCYDAIVGLAGCDKSLPGMMMAMVRLNTPSVFIYGGSILPGRLDGKDVTVQDVFEAVGKHQAGNIGSCRNLHILPRKVILYDSNGRCLSKIYFVNVFLAGLTSLGHRMSVVWYVCVCGCVCVRVCGCACVRACVCVCVFVQNVFTLLVHKGSVLLCVNSKYQNETTTWHAAMHMFVRTLIYC